MSAKDYVKTTTSSMSGSKASSSASPPTISSTGSASDELIGIFILDSSIFQKILKGFKDLSSDVVFKFLPDDMIMYPCDGRNSDEEKEGKGEVI